LEDGQVVNNANLSGPPALALPAKAGALLPDPMAIPFPLFWSTFSLLLSPLLIKAGLNAGAVNETDFASGITKNLSPVLGYENLPTVTTRAQSLQRPIRNRIGDTFKEQNCRGLWRQLS
jgi:hypothetical protein